MRRNRFLPALCALLAAALLTACGRPASSAVSANPADDFTSVPAQSEAQTPAPAGDLSYRAMWVSYLEWVNIDTSSADAYTQAMATVLDNCKSLGLNTVILQVRPFGDAMYPSELFPWSHFLTGTQGEDPGYDPLAIAIDLAHERSLALEAWINPYRIQLNGNTPSTLAPSNLVTTHPEWFGVTEDGAFLDPALPEVRQYIIDGVMEIVNNYNVDGIQFDDYFYPTTDAAFDAASYSALGGGQDLAVWRRANVDTLVRDVYAAIKAAKPGVVFGISPQGNNDNNYNGQYSDVKLWLSTPGYVDYIMPQVYWGYGYTLKNGSTQFAFENITAEWASYPRADGVRLAFGLGAYRIGTGDGGAQDQAQWESGRNLADMVNTLAQTSGVSGYGLYRYDNLFNNGEYAALAQQECAALTGA